MGERGGGSHAWRTERRGTRQDHRAARAAVRRARPESRGLLSSQRQGPGDRGDGHRHLLGGVAGERHALRGRPGPPDDRAGRGGRVDRGGARPRDGAGGLSFRGAVCYQTASAPLARLNRVAILYEHETDRDDNVVTTYWEWQ